MKVAVAGRPMNVNGPVPLVQAAKFLGITAQTARRYLREGAPRAGKNGKGSLVVPTELAAWAASRGKRIRGPLMDLDAIAELFCCEMRHLIARGLLNGTLCELAAAVLLSVLLRFVEHLGYEGNHPAAEELAALGKRGCVLHMPERKTRWRDPRERPTRAGFGQVKVRQ